MPFYALPTTDIHLVKGGSITGMDIFQLETLDYNLNVVTGITFVDFDPAVVTVALVSQKCKFTAVAAGHTIGRIRRTTGSGATAQYEDCLVSIWVHAGVDKFWVGNDQITIHTGAAYHGYVMSVFAKFTDGEIGDITYHPYLKYTPADATKYTVTDHIVKSTATVGSSPVSTTISVSLTGISALPAIPVTVNVKKAYNTARPILEKVHKGTSTATHTNLLILGDGFTSKADFEIYRNILVQNLTNNNLFSPYHLIKDKMTIWSGFEPTHDAAQGASISNGVNLIDSYFPDFEETDGTFLYKLIELVGVPNASSPATYTAAVTAWSTIIGATDLPKFTAAVFDNWKNKNTVKGYIANKDTVLGTSFGERLGDKIKSSVVKLAKLPSVNSWYRPTDQQRGIFFDRRRYPQKKHLFSAAFSSAISSGSVITTPGPFDTYLGSLKYIDPTLTNPTTGPQYNIGNTWQSVGKDRLLIAVISNHYKWGGQQVSVSYGTGRSAFEFGAVAGSLNNELGYSVSNGATVPEKLVDNVNAAANVATMDALKMVGLFAHELMHAFGLLDEYEGGQSHTMIDGQADKDLVNETCNVMTLDKVMKAGTAPVDKKIDPDKIKWNFRRVAASSTTVGDATGSSPNVSFKVEATESAKWKGIMEYKDPTTSNPVTLPLYLKSGVYDAAEARLFYELAIEKIVSVNTTTHIITVKVKASDVGRISAAKLKKGSCIYLPKRFQNDYDPAKQELFLINPRVKEYLAATNTPFAVNTAAACAVGNNKPEYPPADTVINAAVAASALPAFASPKNRFLVTGIYEGGAVWNCNVFRGNGWSILRQTSLYRYPIGEFDGTDPELDPAEAPPSTALNAVKIYSRFDLVAKYYLLSRIFPTNLEKLDSLEYKDTDASVL